MQVKQFKFQLDYFILKKRPEFTAILIGNFGKGRPLKKRAGVA